MGSTVEKNKCALGASEWLDRCAELTRQRSPDLNPEMTKIAAEVMYRAWPTLTPEEAVASYFNDSHFPETEWSFFEVPTAGMDP